MNNFIEHIYNYPKEIVYDEERKEFIFKNKYGIKNKDGKQIKEIFLILSSILLKFLSFFIKINEFCKISKL